MSAKVFADGWVTREEVKVSVTGKPDQAGSVTIKFRNSSITLEKHRLANLIGGANGRSTEEKY